MTTYKIPPRNEAGIRVEQISNTLQNTLEPFFKGKNKKERLQEAVNACIKSLKPMLKLPKTPDKGATTMTEGASQGQVDNYRARPKNL